MTIRRILAFAVKAIISVTLLILAIRGVNLDAITQRLSDTHLAWAGSVIAVVFIQTILVALRWRLVVIQAGASLGALDAIRFSLISIFFNQTLPSTIGGDAARIWLLARQGTGWKTATYSVLADRAIGLFALCLLVIVCLPWTLALLQNSVGQLAVVAIAACGFGGMLAFLLLGNISGSWLDRWWAIRHVTAIARVVFKILSKPYPGFVVSGLSFVIHLLTILAVWCAGQAITASLTFTDTLFLVPPVILIATVPMSIAGWGLRESAMMVAFSYAGLADSDGLIVSLLFGAATFVVGILGGLIWVVSGYRTLRHSSIAESVTPAATN